MRSLRAPVLVACLAVPAAAAAQADPPAPAAAQAQTPAAGAASAPETGEAVFGARLTGVAGDPGRFQRFRDLRSGATLDRLRYVRDRERWTFEAAMDHVGYRDARYFASFERYGGLRASFEWDQVPLFYSDVTRTPYREELTGVFRLDNVIRAGVENRTATLSSYASEVRPFDTRARRDVAAARVGYSLTRDLDVRLAFTSTGRAGEQPWGATFGLSNATELPAPVEQRTNDLNATAEWSNGRGMLRLAYDGSWFENAAEALIWDNPLRLTDQTYGNAYVAGDASSQGRMALWPDSSAHTVSAAGSLALPARTRAFAHVAVGSWLQDERLLPHTINTAIAPIPLARETADAEARITSMTYRVTSRPTGTLWLSGQYRLYDFDNRTPHFAVGDYVRVDQAVGTSVTGGSHAFGYTRHFVDLDASFTPFRFTAFRLGYGQQNEDRTFRIFEETTDHTVRASIDGTGFTWGSVRLQYDHSVRTGEGLDEQVLSEIGEQVSLRQFDIANRTRDRVTALVQLVPLDMLGLQASLAVGQESRPESAFGLQDNDLRAVSVGVDVAPGETVTTALSYGYERYTTRQQSRQANPGVQFADPTRDWWTDMDEDVHTVTFSVELPQLTARTSARVGYDYVGSRAAYLYSVRPDSALPAPQQLPPVWNVFHVASADLRHTLTRRLALGLGYRFDGYDVEDFALSPGTLNSPLIPAFVNLMYQWRPYDAHGGYVRLIYGW